jgi:hypothetical protein
VKSIGFSLRLSSISNSFGKEEKVDAAEPSRALYYFYYIKYKFILNSYTSVSGSSSYSTIFSLSLSLCLIIMIGTLEVFDEEEEALP